METGISFTEFAYMLIQAYDFWHLWKTEKLRAADGRQRPVGQHHRRRRAHRAQGRGRARTASSFRSSPPPRAPSSARARRARSTSTRQKTSPYKFFQFWLNSDDRDVERLARVLHLLPGRGDRRADGRAGARAGQAHRAAPARGRDDGAHPRRGDGAERGRGEPAPLRRDGPARRRRGGAPGALDRRSPSRGVPARRARWG